MSASRINAVSSLIAPVAAWLLHNCATSVSAECLFVETGKVDLPVNALVSVAFTLSRDDNRDEFCLPALVVHRTDSGAGVMFLESELDMLRTLRRALQVTASLTPERTIRGDRRVATGLEIQASSNATALASRQIN